MITVDIKGGLHGSSEHIDLQAQPVPSFTSRFRHCIIPQVVSI